MYWGPCADAVTFGNYIGVHRCLFTRLGLPHHGGLSNQGPRNHTTKNLHIIFKEMIVVLIALKDSSHLRNWSHIHAYCENSSSAFAPRLQGSARSATPNHLVSFVFRLPWRRQWNLCQAYARKGEFRGGPALTSGNNSHGMAIGPGIVPVGVPSCKKTASSPLCNLFQQETRPFHFSASRQQYTSSGCFHSGWEPLDLCSLLPTDEHPDKGSLVTGNPSRGQ